MKGNCRPVWKEIIQYRTGLIVCAILLVAMLPVGSRAFATTNTGYKDFSTSGSTAPTGQRPQSKLWVNDGIWWGSLYNSSKKQFQIYRFDWAANTWATTGTLIDSRAKSSADTLWDGSHLYIVSAMPAGFSGDISIRLMRYSYVSATRTYSIDSGFPVTIVSKAVEVVVMDKDTLGELWITYTVTNSTKGRNVYVTHTTTNDLTWVSPYVIPLPGANDLDPDDISAVVAFSGNIGVMWSNQTENSMYFGIHEDGAPDSAWTAKPALQAPKYADDHMNLKALTADPSGQVYAIVKTSLNDVYSSTSSQPLILLLRLDNHGSWTRRTVWRVSDSFTRPIVLLDTQNRDIYAFAAQEYPNQTSGAVFYKQIPLDDAGAQFTTGVGTPFMVFSSDTHINNPSSTKQNLNSATGLLVVAADDTSHYYFHNKINLGTIPPTSTSTPTSTPTDTPVGVTTEPPTNTPTAPPTDTPTPTPVGSAVLFSDGFEGGNFSAWSLVKIGGDGAASVQANTVYTGGFAAKLLETANTGSVAYVRTSLPQPETDLTISLDINIAQEGISDAHVPILRLFDSTGARMLNLYRQNLSGSHVWVGYGSNYSTTGLLPLNTWSHFDVHVITAGASASTIQVYQDGTLIYRTTTATLSSSGVLSAQVGNDTAKQIFTLFADNVQISR